jgi:hypothetical protein
MDTFESIAVCNGEAKMTCNVNKQYGTILSWGYICDILRAKKVKFFVNLEDIENLQSEVHCESGGSNGDD